MKQHLDSQYQKYKIRRSLRIVILLLLVVTITLSICSIILKWSFLYPLGTFLLASVLVRYRNSLEFLKKKKK